MEADWEVEIGGNAPVIDACWEGFVDLRLAPERASLLPEARELPALADVLIQLNSPRSPIWTAKCDLWRPGELDLDEHDAQPGEGDCALACYLDLLPRTEQQWPALEQVVEASRTICGLIQRAPLRCCRADLIVRRAHLAPDRQDLGITAYVSACGPTPGDARTTLEAGLRVFAESVFRTRNASTLQ